MFTNILNWGRTQEPIPEQPVGSEASALNEEQLKVAQEALKTSGEGIAEKKGEVSNQVTPLPAQPKEESQAAQIKRLQKTIKAQKLELNKQTEQIGQLTKQNASVERKLRQYEAKNKEVQVIKNSENTRKKSTELAKELEEAVEIIKKIVIQGEEEAGNIVDWVDKIKKILKKLSLDLNNLQKDLEKNDEPIKTQISLLNSLVGNWNSSQLEAEKSLSLLKGLQDSINQPVKVEIFLKKVSNLKEDIEKLSGDNFKSVDQQKLGDLQNINRDLQAQMEELKDKEKLFDLLTKFKEQSEKDHSQYKDSIISKLEISKEADKENALNSLTSIFNSDKENYSVLFKKTTERWNQAVEGLWLIGNVLASLKISVDQVRLVEDLKDKLKTLGQESREEIVAYAADPKKEVLEEKLKARDTTFLELLNVKGALEKEYETIKKELGELTQGDVIKASMQKSLESYALNPENSKEIEAKQIVLHKQYEESQIKLLSDLEALWKLTNELMQNAAYQLDKFVTAYNNNGTPKYSWMQKIIASDFYQNIVKDPSSAKSFFAEKPVEVTVEKQ